MHPITSLVKACLTALLVSATLPALAAAELHDLPSQFTDLNVTMQNRVCGELLTGMSLNGVQALQSMFPDADVPQAERGPVYEAGAQGIVLLTMSGALNVDERVRAGEVTAAIDKLAPERHVEAVRFCQKRVEAWIRAGDVDKSLIDKVYVQAQELLDGAFSMNSSPTP